jgi:hypothetical protein
VGARGSSRGRGPGGLQRPGVAHEQGMREGPVGWTPPRRERGGAWVVPRKRGPVGEKENGSGLKKQ